MRQFFLFFVVSFTLNAENLQELISLALNKSHSLETINKQVEGVAYLSERSDNLDNPHISIATNTLDNQEKMSQTTFALQQNIPFLAKLDAKQSIANTQGYLLAQQLQSAKVKLVYMVKSKVYSIAEIEALYKLTLDYITLTKQNINLYESYSSIESADHMGLMKAELSLNDLKIKLIQLDAKRENLYAQLSYLCATPITIIEFQPDMQTKPSLQSFTQHLANNPELQIKTKEIAKEDAKLHLEKLQYIPDFTVSAGYNYRENFNDFFTVGIGFSLPIYGNESLKIQQQQSQLLAKESMQKDTQLQVESELKIYYTQMEAAYKVYHIVQDEALAQVGHMFDLSNATVRTGGDLFKYIDLLFTKLSLEKKSVKAMADFYRSKAKIEALTGELQ